MIFTHVYSWKKYRPELYGKRCLLMSRGSQNCALVEFEGGTRHIVDRKALRRYAATADEIAITGTSTVRDIHSHRREDEDLQEISLLDKPKIGIYFLCAEETVLYVGQSVNVFSRVHSHRERQDFAWNRAYWIEYPPHLLDRYERYWIDRLNPQFNLDSETVNKRGLVRTPYTIDGLWQQNSKDHELVPRQEHLRRKSIAKQRDAEERLRNFYDSF